MLNIYPEWDPSLNVSRPPPMLRVGHTNKLGCFGWFQSHVGVLWWEGQESNAGGANEVLIGPCPQFRLFGGTLPKMAALWREREMKHEKIK